ncbi:MAG: hypothetical protein FD155_3041 [Bacteroidetes bacterium]|nr:MAG: hypothetical protein FD155_3041 [Bacteroidota bacterium]
MKKLTSTLIFFWFSMGIVVSQPLIVNHSSTQISEIPQSAIDAAKSALHIAYGHTSHGSQLTEGMDGLVGFMNANGYPVDLYAWSNGGSGGTLDLHDYAMDGDVGYYPEWVNNTRNYLGIPNAINGRGSGPNADVNVIIWSWCGQVEEKFVSGTLFSEYLNPMAELESDYFGIKFVYMTGHLDHWDDANNKAANQAIRDYCQANNKVLYDFADIESYDPDDTYFQYSSDDCSYYNSSGTLLGNWATEWQDTHTEGVDWYQCGAAHTYPLNSNQKAYAAWWLWAALAGWDQNLSSTPSVNLQENISIFPNPCKDWLSIKSLTGKPIQSVNLKNPLGQTVICDRRKSVLAVELSLKELPEGIYFLSFMIENQTLTQKIILK